MTTATTPTPTAESRGAGELANLTACVVGLGYIGLPTAAMLASRGVKVNGVDVNEHAVETINRGAAHIVEPDLDMLVRAAVQTKRLHASGAPSEADVFMIAVPTPFRDGHKPDLSYVFAAIDSICPVLREGNLIVLESTIPPGTTERAAERIAEATGMRSPAIKIAHAPERVLPGRVLREVIENDRIVGGLDEASSLACAEFYRKFVTGTVHVTSARTAETAKLVENAYRDVNIAFANELSLIADKLDLDVWELIRLANRHPRVNILSPGPGVGGHCIAVDPWFLVDAVPDQTNLIAMARKINDSKPGWVVERVKKRAERFKDAQIACLGLAYKPDVDDLRESPAVEVVHGLLEAGLSRVRVVEPNITRHDTFDLQPLEDAVRDADIVVLLVAHHEFLSAPANLFSEKVIIDACGALQLK